MPLFLIFTPPHRHPLLHPRTETSEEIVSRAKAEFLHYFHRLGRTSAPSTMHNISFRAVEFFEFIPKILVVEIYVLASFNVPANSFIRRTNIKNAHPIYADLF